MVSHEDEQLALFFSGGKDSTLALHRLGRKVKYLVSTITKDYDRVSIHGLRRQVLLCQAESLNLPLKLGYIPKDANNESYEQAMSEVLLELKREGIYTIAFGDIFLEDIRAYREAFLRKLGMKAIFPLWKEDTKKLALEFLSLGFKAVVISSFHRNLLGKEYSLEFLESLEKDIDPCGENGEFHTFVYDGPIFSFPLRFKLGRIVQASAYHYIDVLLHDAKCS